MIGLVSGTHAKHDKAMKAGDLYRSPLFILSRRYVEKHCDDWGILSAKHGLLDPEMIIEPYFQALQEMRPMDRARWARSVRGQIIDRWGSSTIFMVFAGKHYRPAIQGLQIIDPLEGVRSIHHPAHLRRMLDEEKS